MFKSVKDFFFPKDFSTDMMMSQGNTQYYVNKGMEWVRNERGQKWVNFWMWVPVIGNWVFYREGKRDEKRKDNKK
tara:strand:- start:83 stop:307 length:225 start_codon:yes stop_codon:yes gene_type:complete